MSLKPQVTKWTLSYKYVLETHFIHLVQSLFSWSGVCIIYVLSDLICFFLLESSCQDIITFLNFCKIQDITAKWYSLTVVVVDKTKNNKNKTWTIAYAWKWILIKLYSFHNKSGSFIYLSLSVTFTEFHYSYIYYLGGFWCSVSFGEIKCYMPLEHHQNNIPMRYLCAYRLEFYKYWILVIAGTMQDHWGSNRCCLTSIL